MRGFLTIAMLACCSIGMAQEKTVAAGRPKAETFSGCVTPSTQDRGKLVLKTEDSCSELDGKALVAGKLSGHVVTLDGVLSLAQGSDPETIAVSSVKGIGETCSETCKLQPPGSRGLPRKKGGVVGKVGGTPGAQPTKPASPDDPKN